MNTSTRPVGKRYEGGAEIVRPEHVRAYALASGDPNPRYLEASPIAPPIFHMRLLRDLMFDVILDPELDLDVLRLVHGEHEARFHGPLRAGDLVQRVAFLEGAVQKSSGLLVQVRFEASVEGRMVVEARSSFFVRDPSARRDNTARVPPVERPSPAHERILDVATDQSYRYAEASLDVNPIHVDSEVARAAGFPDVILQGLCTMAMSGAAALDTLAASDPTRLLHYTARFVRPVLNGARLRVGLWPRGDGDWDLETRSEDGSTLHLSGRLAVGPAEAPTP